MNSGDTIADLAFGKKTMKKQLGIRIAVTLAMCFLAFSPGIQPASAQEEPRIVGFPFKRGYWALCSRGAKKGHGWVFNLSEGPPVVAAAPGRVFQVDEPMGILVDHGEGRYGAYMINGRWEPEVKHGELIAAGTVLADIDKRGGREGHGAPFLNFTMRGPNHEKTHDLRFRLAGSKKGVEINRKTKYLSGTRKGVASGGSFRDSVLKGDEFRKNRIAVTSGNRTFWLNTGGNTVYEGKVLEKDAERVVFQVWQKGEDGKQEVVYDTRATPNPDGTFVLTAQVPSTVNGPCMYRLAIKSPKRGVIGPVKLRAGAMPSVDTL